MASEQSEAAPVRRHGTKASISSYPLHAKRESYSVPQGQTSVFAAPHKPLGDPDSIQERAKGVARQVENLMDTAAQPIKPYLPAIGRFLIVCTFLEDALRYVAAALARNLTCQLIRGHLQNVYAMERSKVLS